MDSTAIGSNIRACKDVIYCYIYGDVVKWNLESQTWETEPRAKGFSGLRRANPERRNPAKGVKEYEQAASLLHVSLLELRHADDQASIYMILFSKSTVQKLVVQMTSEIPYRRVGKGPMTFGPLRA